MRKLWKIFGRTGMLLVTAILAVKFADKIKDLAGNVPFLGNFLKD